MRPRCKNPKTTVNNSLKCSVTFRQQLQGLLSSSNYCLILVFISSDEFIPEYVVFIAQIVRHYDVPIEYNTYYTLEKIFRGRELNFLFILSLLLSGLSRISVVYS